jgi:hypothetical protein
MRRETEATIFVVIAVAFNDAMLCGKLRIKFFD